MVGDINLRLTQDGKQSGSMRRFGFAVAPQVIRLNLVLQKERVPAERLFIKRHFHLNNRTNARLQYVPLGISDALGMAKESSIPNKTTARPG